MHRDDDRRAAGNPLTPLADGAEKFCSEMAESARRQGMRAAVLGPGQEMLAGCRDGESLLGATYLQHPGEDIGRAFMITVSPGRGASATVQARLGLLAGAEVTEDGRLEGTPEPLPDAETLEPGEAGAWLAEQARKALGARPGRGTATH